MRELTPVGSSLVTMAKAVREAMRQASVALLAGDGILAQQVTVRATEIAVLNRVVEDRVYELLGKQTGDPRTTMTALHAAADLDRMGALAAHVARATLRRQPTSAAAPELAELFRAMSVVADDLAAKIVTALAESDVVLAGRLDQDDDAMDELHRRLFAVMLSPDWPLGVEEAIDGALLGRYYERYADHAVSIGRHIQRLATGGDIELTA